MKKTIILKESELIELIESTVTDIQEQSASKDKILSGDYNPSSPNYKIQSNYEKKQREAAKKLYNEFMYKCEEYREDSKKIARKIVNMEFEDWTTDDTAFYIKYKDDGSQPCTQLNIRNWSVDEWIAWVERGEPGICDNPWHCILPVIEVGVLFIPYIGWGLRVGLAITAGMTDAMIYWKEGDEEMAGLVAFFSVLPGVPSVVKKFPFVKAWAKGGGKKMAGKIIAGERLTMLEYYQLKALTTESAEKFINKEVQKHLAAIAAKESIEIAGQKITKDAIEKAMEKGYLEMTVEGVKSKISKEMLEALSKYTAKQQHFLVKFAAVTTPFVVAYVAYSQIYKEVVKAGALGPKKLIEKLWGIDPDVRPTDSIVSAFFMKKEDREADVSFADLTWWDSLKLLFQSDGSQKDGELMIHAIKNGWNPIQLPGKGDYTIVPKKYRTEGYNKWVNDIITNPELIEAFMSDGSEEENNLLLKLITEEPEWDPELAIVPEKYRTKAFKEWLEQEHEKEKGGYDDLRKKAEKYRGEK